MTYKTTPATVQTHLVYLDASDARNILGTNVHNRNPKQKRACYYDDMVNCRWVFNGEPIKFAYDKSRTVKPFSIKQSNHEELKFGAHEVLLDGGNRMLALAATEGSGIRLPFLVIRGLRPEAQETMDQGVKRSAADKLKLAGVNVDGSMTAAINLIIGWQDKRLHGHRVSENVFATESEIVEWGKSHRAAVDYMREASAKGWGKHINTSPSVVLATAYMFSRTDEDDADFFFSAMRSGANLEEGNPILTLRRKLDRIKEQSRTPGSRGKEVSRRELIYYFTLTWNAWRKEKSISRLSLPKGGQWTSRTVPEVF